MIAALHVSGRLWPHDTVHRSGAIRFAPVRYGFGPAGKALHVARRLRALLGDARRLELVADPGTAELAEPGLFDRIAAEPPTERARLVVSVMSPTAAEQARARDEELWVVDSLSWFWDGPRPTALLADRYLYQDIPLLPVPARNLDGIREPTPVGAIDTALRAAPPGGGTLLSLSGIETFEASLQEGNLWWVELLMDALEGLLASDAAPQRNLELAGNGAAIERYAGRLANGLRRHVTQQDFATALASCDAIVAPPGLTTIIEALRGGRRLRLLPAQNFSQLRIARALRRRCAVPSAPWPGEVADWLADATLPEPLGGRVLLGVIAQDRLRREHFTEACLRALVTADAPALDPGVVRDLIGEGDGAADVALAIAEAVS